jgi:hypothetical protein
VSIQSQWEASARWPETLPSTTDDIRAFVERLRHHVIREVEVQNDVDEACHLIEKLVRERDQRPHKASEGADRG